MNGSIMLRSVIKRVIKSGLFHMALLTLLIVCQPVLAAPPDILIWNGNQQQFGHIGNPQNWINILGNVYDADGIASLTYTLNDGSDDRPLSIGPDNRRLLEPGDFNVEIDYSELVSGSNQVAITAVDKQEPPETTTTVVTVEYVPGNVWPFDYAIDWSSVNDMLDVVQIVDGQWSFDGSGIFPTVLGYDRTFVVGDELWADYEVTIPITVRSIDPNFDPNINPYSIAPGVGFTNRWLGHTLEADEQPHVNWIPQGATAWYNFGSERFQLEIADSVYPLLDQEALSFDVLYWWKLRAETLNNGQSLFSFKVWSEQETEPPDWQMSGTGTPPDINSNGSLIFIAHHVDATFGNITVVDLVNDEQPPLISDVTAISQTNDALINWNTDEPATSAVEFGNTTSYEFGTVADDLLKTSHSLALAGLTPSETYHYRLSSTDGRGNISISQDFTFTYEPSLPASDIRSDDFSAQELDTSIWDFSNPDNDVTLTMTGTQAMLQLPAAGFDREFWTTSDINRMPRLMQPAADTDFEVEAKFESPVSANYQLQGILVEQSPLDLMRVEFLYYENQPRIFIASVVGGIADILANIILPSGDAPMYLRVTRAGDNWTVRYSTDGTIWNTAPSFDKIFNVSAVGVYAANSAGTPHTAVVDYFFNNAFPIVPEDGACAGDWDGDRDVDGSDLAFLANEFDPAKLAELAAAFGGVCP